MVPSGLGRHCSWENSQVNLFGDDHWVGELTGKFLAPYFSFDVLLDIFAACYYQPQEAGSLYIKHAGMKGTWHGWPRLECKPCIHKNSKCTILC